MQREGKELKVILKCSKMAQLDTHLNKSIPQTKKKIISLSFTDKSLLFLDLINERLICLRNGITASV